MFSRLSGFALCIRLWGCTCDILVEDPLHVLFGVGAAKPRTIACRLAHVRVHSGIIRRVVIVRPAGLVSTASLHDRACS